VAASSWSTEVSLEAWPRDSPTHYPFSVKFREDELTVEFGGVGASDSLGETEAYRVTERVLGRPPTAIVNTRELARLIDPAGKEELGVLERMAFIAVAEWRQHGELWQDVLLELRPDARRAPDGASQEELSWLAPGDAAIRLPLPGCAPPRCSRSP
jgi:hypothetical protein